jgi:CRP/FNR family transcriptional regulator, cyclic AMP receptor protein
MRTVARLLDHARRVGRRGCDPQTPARSRTTSADGLAVLHPFRDCTRSQLRAIDSLATGVRVEAGRVLCREGERGGEFFVIVSGAVAVSLGNRVLRQLDRGEGFGEVALVDHGPRIATATALAPSELLVFNRREFATLLDRVPSVTRVLLGTAIARLRDAEDRCTQLGSELQLHVAGSESLVR